MLPLSAGVSSGWLGRRRKNAARSLRFGSREAFQEGRPGVGGPPLGGGGYVVGAGRGPRLAQQPGRNRPWAQLGAMQTLHEEVTERDWGGSWAWHPHPCGSWGHRGLPGVELGCDRVGVFHSCPFVICPSGNRGLDIEGSLQPGGLYSR